MAAEQAANRVPRIALVYGDASRAAHLRAAMAGRADIAYAVSAADFDSAQLERAEVAAALVNVDDGDWLDAIEAKLEAAGVPVIFNDPEISSNLEGWEFSRWLRHLAAKLAGSGDFDPPRPVMASVTPDPGNALAFAAAAAVADPVAVDAAPVPAPTMSSTLPVHARFGPEVAVSETTRSAVPLLVSGVLATRQTSAPMATSSTLPVQARFGPEIAVSETTRSAAPLLGPGAVTTRPIPALVAVATLPVRASFGPEIAVSEPTRSSAPVLVPDGFACARSAPGAPTGLADAATREPVAPCAPILACDIEEAVAERPLSAHEIATMTADFAAVPEPATAATEPEDAKALSPPPAVVSAASAGDIAAGDCDAGVRNRLPAQEDWELVDPEAAAAVATPRSSDEPEAAATTLTDSFDGLELVPMEDMAPVEPSDPIERWLDAAEVRSSAQDQDPA
jgi:hypothetical protein